MNGASEQMQRATEWTVWNTIVWCRNRPREDGKDLCYEVREYEGAEQVLTLPFVTSSWIRLYVYLLVPSSKCSVLNPQNISNQHASRMAAKRLNRRVTMVDCDTLYPFQATTLIITELMAIRFKSPDYSSQKGKRFTRQNK